MLKGKYGNDIEFDQTVTASRTECSNLISRTRSRCFKGFLGSARGVRRSRSRIGRLWGIGLRPEGPSWSAGRPSVESSAWRQARGRRRSAPRGRWIMRRRLQVQGRRALRVIFTRADSADGERDIPRRHAPRECPRKAFPWFRWERRGLRGV